MKQGKSACQKGNTTCTESNSCLAWMLDLEDEMSSLRGDMRTLQQEKKRLLMGKHLAKLNQYLHANQLNHEIAAGKEILTKHKVRIEEFYDVFHFMDYPDVICKPSQELCDDFKLFKTHKGISKRRKSNATEEKENN